MKIIVCVKQVADTQSPILVDKETGRLDTRYAPPITNPNDLVALEWAVRQKETDDSEVDAISMGSPSAEKSLRECLAIGADRVLLLSDPAFESSDGYATGVVLAKAIEILKYDLILCGVKAIDSNNGWVNSVIANRLGIPIVFRVTDIRLNQGQKKLMSAVRLSGGNRETVEIGLPCLLAMDNLICKPRYPNLHAILSARKAQIECWDMRKLGLSTDEVGSKGSRTYIKKLSKSKPRPKRVFTPDSSLSAVQRLQLVMSGGITKKKDNKLEGDPARIAQQLIRYLKEEKIIR